MLSPKELDKVCVTHFANIKDARKDLGYTPLVSTAEGMVKCLAYCRELHANLSRERGIVERPHPGWWAAVFSGMIILGLISFNAPIGEWFQASVPLLELMPIEGWRIIFWIAVAIHIGEAIYARIVSKKADLKTSLGWTIQTLLLGWPSTRLLRRYLHKQRF